MPIPQPTAAAGAGGTASYLERIIVPAHKAFIATSALPDPFTQFDLSRDADDAAVGRQVAAVGAEWNRLKQHPVYKSLVARLLQDKAEAVAILSDRTRRQHLRYQLDQADQQVGRALEADLQHVAPYGYVPAAKLPKLIEAHAGRFSESAIRQRAQRLGLLIQERVANIALTPREGAACPEYDTIQQHLAVLGHVSYYEFLGLPFGAPREEVRFYAVQAGDAWRAAPVNDRKTAADALLRLLPVVEESVYYSARVWRLADTLRDRLKLVEHNYVVSLARAHEIPALAADRGFRDVSGELLDRVLIAVAAEEDLTVELRDLAAASARTGTRAQPAAPAWRPAPAPTGAVPLPAGGAADDGVSPVDPADRAGAAAVGALKGALGAVFTFRGVRTPGQAILRLVAMLFVVMLVVAIVGQLLSLAVAFAVSTAIGVGAAWLGAECVAALRLTRHLRVAATEGELARVRTIGRVTYADATGHPVLAGAFPSPARFTWEAICVGAVGMLVVDALVLAASPTTGPGFVVQSILTTVSGGFLWQRWQLARFPVTRFAPAAAWLHRNRLQSLSEAADH